MKRCIPFLALAVLVAAMIYQAATPKTVLTEAPKISWPEIAGYSITTEVASESELTVLPNDTIIEKRKYETADGEWFLVTAVVGGVSKSSIHRPELCLPTQGFSMVSPRNVRVGSTDWRFITLEFKNYRPQLLAYTFYNQAGFKTASHTKRIFRDILDRSFLNRIDRWVMITVNASRADDEAAMQFMNELEGVVAK